MSSWAASAMTGGVSRGVVLPSEAHLRRLMALAVELAARMGLMRWEQEVMEAALGLLRLPALKLEEAAVRQALEQQAAAGAHRPSSAPRLLARDVTALLRALERRLPPGAEEGATAVEAEIIRVSDFFVRQLEAKAFDRHAVSQILERLEWMAREGKVKARVVKQVAELPRVRKNQLAEVLGKLPAYPKVAVKLLRLAGDDEVEFSELERVASSDQVLAGNLISAANSSLYGAAYPIRTIRQAIAYIGLEAARRLLSALQFRALMGTTGRHQQLWRHALEMAQWMECMAACGGLPDPQEAFLMGLMHDVGRLAMEKLPAEAVAAYERLLKKGCEPSLAEILLCGFDHAEAGAELLRYWEFPAAIVEAVQYHHAPEKSGSVGAALLYLGEWRFQTKESPEEEGRLAVALERTGLSAAQLEAADGSGGLLEALAAA